MKIQIKRFEDHIAMTLQGRFDQEVGVDFYVAMQKVLNQAEPARVVVDLSAVDYIDSSAFGKLVQFHQELTQNGRKLVVSRLQPEAAKAAKLLSLHKLLHIDA